MPSYGNFSVRFGKQKIRETVMTIATGPHLRPLGLGQLLDQAIRLYRRNFLKFIGIIAIVQIPLTLLQMLSTLLTVGGMSAPFDDQSSIPTDLGEVLGFIGIGGTIVVAIVTFVLVQGVATAALTRAVAGSYLGQSVGIVEAYRKIGRSWVSLIGALLLTGLIAIGLLIWTLVPCIGWLTGLGMLAFLSMVITPMIAPIIVLEKQAAVDSIRRAWDLARRRFWWVLGFIFILFLFGQLIITIPVILLTYLLQFIMGGGPFALTTTETIIQTVTQSLSQLTLSVIYLPLQLTAITLMYFDLRIRTEGFDLAVLAGSVSGAQADVEAVTVEAPQPEKGNLITWTEMGYFALIEIGALALYFVFVMLLGLLFFAIGAASGSF
jgi:hypothetical protein